MKEVNDKWTTKVYCGIVEINIRKSAYDKDKFSFGMFDGSAWEGCDASMVTREELLKIRDTIDQALKDTESKEV